MSYLFLEYPKCNTCRNAKKWLDEHKITYEDRHIIDRNPSVEELTKTFSTPADWFIRR